MRQYKTAVGRYSHQKIIHQRQMDTILVNIMTHTTFVQRKLPVSSAVVNHLFSSMSKRAREAFAASVSAKQKPIHCTAIIARKLNDKNADMYYHAVLPPCYKAGADSKREELCQQDTETIHHNGDCSIIELQVDGSVLNSIKLSATGSRERSVKRWRRGSLSSEEHWWRISHQKIR